MIAGLHTFFVFLRCFLQIYSIYKNYVNAKICLKTGCFQSIQSLVRATAFCHFEYNFSRFSKLKVG